MLCLDLVEINRVRRLKEQYGQRFLARVYTAGELRYCLSRANGKCAELAARFAAKEAVVKALGTGMRGVSWQEIEVIRNPLGKPQILLHGRAKSIAEQLGVEDIQLSLTHTEQTAGAVAFLCFRYLESDR